MWIVVICNTKKKEEFEIMAKIYSMYEHEFVSMVYFICFNESEIHFFFFIIFIASVIMLFN